MILMYKKIKSRRSRSRVVHSLARTTPRGKGRIKKRPAYRKYVAKRKTKRKR